MIRSTFSGFSMASTALLSTQRAIDVAGQNISNMNTIGYTRQRLDFASISPTGLSASTTQAENKVGQGVMMVGVTQIRDPFLDIQYRNQLSEVGTADAMDGILSRIGDIFDEADSTAIRAAFNDIISQLNAMASPSNAGDSSLDAVVRSSFEVLLNLVHQNSAELDALSSELYDKMSGTTIPDVNAVLENIASLNQSIKNSEVLGNTALELKDQRNSLIDELATYLPIDVKYNKVDIGAGEMVDELLITFTDTNNVTHTLVDDAAFSSFQFGGTTPPYTLNIINPVDATNNAVDIADSMQDGVLKGNLDMMNKSEIYDGTDIKGIGYYEKTFDLFVNELATTMNDLNATVDAAGNTVRNDLFTGGPPFTADSIQISDAWKNGTIQLKTTTETDPSSTAYDNILAMVEALTSTDYRFEYTRADGTVVSPFEGTIQELYDSIQNTQAIDRKASASLLANHVAVLESIANSKDSISGVNLDEETMDLMRYQQSYGAASRLMTTLDEMLDKLINQTGVVGR